MTVVLHIGMQKTGSSSLEHTFAANRSLLAASGIDYLDHGSPAHHELAWAIQRRRNLRQPVLRMASFKRAMTRSRARLIVLSSENFCDLKPAQIAALAGLIPKRREVRVVCYFRHPIDWVEAQINQKIKSSGVQGFRRFVPVYTRRTDYFEMIERWAAVFGAASVRARIYRSGRDVIADFMTIIGAGAELRLPRPPEPINVSLSEPLIRIKLLANRYGHSPALRAALNDIQIATGMGPPARFLLPDDRWRVIAASQDSMRRLWDAYVDPGEPEFEMTKAECLEPILSPDERRKTLADLVRIFGGPAASSEP